jgi:hypothetical protein
MTFEAGKPRPEGAGRKPGVPNKETAACKEAIELAFEGLGGVDALTQWARREPGLFYTRIWTRLLPKNIEIKGVLSLEQLVEASMKLIEAQVVEPPKLEAGR